MKSRMKILVLCFWIAGTSHAQTSKSNVTLNWTPERIALTLFNDKIEVNLQGFSPDTEWIFGVRTTDSNFANAQAGYLEFSTTTSAVSQAIRSPSHVENWPKDKLQTQPGQFNLFSFPRSNSACFVYLETPLGTSVRLSLNSVEILSFKLSDGVLIHNGTLVPVPVRNLGSLINRLVVQRVPSKGSPSALLPLKSGEYLATIEILRPRALNLPRPKIDLQLFRKTEIILFRIKIDENGEVYEAQKVSGDDLISNSIEVAIHTWKFESFTVDGKKSRIVASIPFFVDKDSRSLTSPVWQ